MQEKRRAISSTPKACGLRFHHPRRKRVKCPVCGRHLCADENDQPPECGEARFAHDLPGGKNGLARRQTAVHQVVVLGHSWRAKYGHLLSFLASAEVSASISGLSNGPVSRNRRFRRRLESRLSVKNHSGSGPRAPVSRARLVSRWRNSAVYSQ